MVSYQLVICGSRLLRKGGGTSDAKIREQTQMGEDIFKGGFQLQRTASIYENMETMCPPNSHQQLKDLGPYVRLYIMCKIIIWVCKFLPPSQKFL